MSRGPALSETQAEALVQRLMSLGAQSTFALHAAVMAMETPGVEATLTIHIPRKTQDFLELHLAVPEL